MTTLRARNTNLFICLMDSAQEFGQGLAGSGLSLLLDAGGTPVAGSDLNGRDLELVGGSFTHMSGPWAWEP